MNTNENSVRQRVKQLMSLDQRFRDSDRELWLKIAEEYGLVLTKSQKFIFMEVPTEGMVSRRRREFSALYPASPLVNERRYHAFKEITDEFSKGNWFKKIMNRRGKYDI